MNNSNKLPNFPPVLLVVIAVILWSTGGLFIKLASLGAVQVNFGRGLFAAITVGLFLIIRRQFRFSWFILIPSVFYALTLTAFVFANKNTTAANAIFLQYTAPIYILVFSPFLLKERFRIADLLVVLICIAGMSLFFLDVQGGGFAPNPIAGNVAGLIAGVCLGLYFMMLRHPRVLKFNPALSVFFGNIIIVALMFPLIIFDPQIPSILDTGAILYLGVFQIGIAYILFTYGVALGVRSLDAGIIGYIEPLLNPIWVFLFVGERPEKWALIGGIVILTSIIIHTVFRHRVSRNDSNS